MATLGVVSGEDAPLAAGAAVAAMATATGVPPAAAMPDPTGDATRREGGTRLGGSASGTATPCLARSTRYSATANSSASSDPRRSMSDSSQILPSTSTGSPDRTSTSRAGPASRRPPWGPAAWKIASYRLAASAVTAHASAGGVTAAAKGLLALRPPAGGAEAAAGVEEASEGSSAVTASPQPKEAAAAASSAPGAKLGGAADTGGAGSGPYWRTSLRKSRSILPSYASRMVEMVSILDGLYFW
mmetsp:Transcript_6870/g.21776  ORF Transcript_6870/g.21776 Transcript_6870/m.21776 type:complete len:244 (+) Transcript_6870:21-752(+)